MQAADVAQLIRDALPDATVTVEGADGQHFDGVVVSPSFDGLRSLQRHRLVYGALGTLISDGTLHALSLKTYTPEQWAELQGEGVAE